MKKWVKISLVIVGIIILCAVLECVWLLSFRKPLFGIKGDQPNFYKGLFYDVYNCIEYSTPQIKAKGTKFVCPSKQKEEEKEKVVSIVDNSKTPGFVCATQLEHFYSEGRYAYYFSCLKSQYVVVNYESGKSEPVKEALAKGTITIKDLDTFGISYIKYDMLNLISIVDKTKEMDHFSCQGEKQIFYTDDKFTYFFPCQKSEYVIVEYSDNTIETVQEALTKGHIKIGDLDRFGISYGHTTNQETDEENLKLTDSFTFMSLGTSSNDLAEVKIFIKDGKIYSTNLKTNVTNLVFEKEKVAKIAKRSVCCAGDEYLLILTANGNAYLSKNLLSYQSRVGEELAINKLDVSNVSSFKVVYAVEEDFGSQLYAITKDGKEILVQENDI